MKNDLIKLLNAQEIDLEIDKLMRSKKDYPKQMEVLKKEIDDLKKTIVEKENRFQEIENNRRNIESEIEAEKELLEQKEKRLLETKNNKEYTAVHNEIELARERIDSLETEDLELMTEQDILSPEIAELKKNQKVTKKANTATIAVIQKNFSSIETDITDFEEKREKELQNVNNSRGMKIYNRLRKGKSGLAVTQVDKEKLTCRGCFKQLPPQKVLEVKRAQKIILCENCGRILVWDSRDEE